MLKMYGFKYKYNSSYIGVRSMISTLSVLDQSVVISSKSIQAVMFSRDNDDANCESCVVNARFT